MLKRWFGKFFRVKKKPGKVPVVGLGNKIINNGKIKNVQFDIIGDHNTIIINSHSELRNCKIYMRGNGHTLRMGSYAKFQGGELYFEDDHCTIELGDNTFIVSVNWRLQSQEKAS